MTIEGPRVLAKTLTGVSCQTDGEYGVMENFIGEGWEAVGVHLAAQRSYFDLSGYSMDKLTTFIQGTDFQDAGPPTSTDTRMFVINLITTEYVGDAEIINTYGTAAPGLFTSTGFPESTLNMEQVIYGSRRTYKTNLAAGAALDFLPLFNVDTWGTGNSVTVDKLHITRILMSTTINKLFFVPPVNVVVIVIVAKEDDLPFLMRQKRSYELATGP